ncbi:MAG: hypothetical protein ACRDFB_09645 [Rhabdochlamydiaceae bacterium]
MDSFISEVIQDTLTYLREVAKTTPSLFATEEEMTYFKPSISKQKKETIKALPPPLPMPAVKKPVLPAPIIQKTPPKPMAAVEKKNLHEMRQIIEKTFPDFSLRETIPDDSHAKKMARLWEETYLTAQIMVIAFGEVGPGLEFLKNVTHAIDRLIAPAQLIEGPLLEKENGWELLLANITNKMAQHNSSS